ncbi:MAG: hypothetical protein ACYTFO_10860 [Planctomycetota bacterium]|jgi:hypothetical protein
MIASLFVHPMVLSGEVILWLALPLCVSIAVIHRTMRAEHLRGLAWRIAGLSGLMMGGLAVLAAVLWLLLAHWPG